MTTQAINNIIVGLGKTGLSVARYLHSQKQDYIVVDNKPNAAQKSALQAIRAVELIEGEFDAKLLSLAKVLIVSPGIAISHKAIATAAKNGVTIIGDIELFAQHLQNSPAKIAAITGSNGKSTCVSLLYAMAQQAGVKVKLGGNIGIPALDLLDNDTELFILELSSFQLETTNSLNCIVGCVLNLSPDHLDRYPDYLAYISAKQRLLNQCQQIVICADDKVSRHWHINHQQTSFSIEQTDCNYSIIDGFLNHNQQSLIASNAIKLPGKHNKSNALACLAIGNILGLELEAMLTTLRNFTGLVHRSQLVATINEVTWINDSKATNVGATLAAIASFADQKNIILIAGGQTKAANLLPLQHACKTSVKIAILFGEDAELINTVIADFTDCYKVSDLALATELAQKLSSTGDVVLLSPAGASFDMFDNYQARGEAFIKLTTNIANHNMVQPNV